MVFSWWVRDVYDESCTYNDISISSDRRCKMGVEIKTEPWKKEDTTRLLIRNGVFKTPYKESATIEKIYLN